MTIRVVWSLRGWCGYYQGDGVTAQRWYDESDRSLYHKATAHKPLCQGKKGSCLNMCISETVTIGCQIM